MSTVVDLGPGPAPRVDVGSLPVRLPLGEGALRHLAGLAEMPLPWPQRPPSGRRTTERLGPAGPVDAAPDPAAELAALGLLDTGGRVPAEVLGALAPFTRAEVHVVVDLARRPVAAPRPAGGSSRLRAWHRWSGDRVAWLAAAGERFELGWCGLTWWHNLLSTLVPGPAGVPGAEAPAEGLTLPLSLLLASGSAVRHGRDDLMAELLRRQPDEVRAGQPLDVARAAHQLRLVHGGVTARLRATVAAVGPDRRLGVVSWLRYADGWRALLPEPGAAGRVRLEPVAPSRLGAEVARLAVGVRAR